jgi:hypothetical protein
MTAASTNADANPAHDIATESTEAGTTVAHTPWSTTRLIKAGIGAGLAVAIAGGYAGPWNWTGFTANGSLWDWLHLLLLPATFGTLPLWLREHQRIGRTRTRALAAGLGLFAILVTLGYGFNWTWTGFPGNTVWDWLELLLLPAVIVAWPVINERIDHLGPRSVATLTATGTALIILAIGGYTDHWAWTGFAGNTLWDWLQLLLLPVVLPWWVLPSVTRWMTVEIEANKHAASARPVPLTSKPPDTHPPEKPSIKSGIKVAPQGR